MIVNSTSLQAMFIGFKTLFNKGSKEAGPSWPQIATEVPSSNRSTTYAWLGQFPAFREWVGDRVLNNIAAHGYNVENKMYESSIVVSRSDIEDDQVGVYGPMFEEMGRAAATHPDELIFGLLKNGTTEKCFDGRPFFDTAHPVGLGETPTPISNYQDGTGPSWYLLDVSRAIKPLLFQVRRKYDLVAMNRAEDEGVFMRNEYRYGVDARCAAGFGFWQFAYCSKAPLTADSYKDARAKMLAYKSDEDRPLRVIPRLLVVPPSLEAEARALLVKGKDDGNPWAGSAELLVCPWLD